jgi:small basic protein
MDIAGMESYLIGVVVSAYGVVVEALGADVANFFVTALGIACYAIILGTFYNNFSRKKFFELAEVENATPADEAIRAISLLAKYTLAFPLITFVWFVFLTLFMVFLGTQSAVDVMHIAIAVVAAIRITSYWDEGIAGDLAKMLPLGLLAYFIGDPSFLDVSMFEQKFFEIVQAIPLSIQYLTYIIGLEWALRILLGIKEAVEGYSPRPQEGGGKK